MACSNQADFDLTCISPCTAEEADGRMLLHAGHTVRCGMDCITIRTVDSDVIVIAVHAFREMSGIKELWVDFGVGRSRKLIPIHRLNQNLTDDIITNLPFFHAFTGCDMVSTFCGIGKRTAWKTWMNFQGH